MVRKGEKKSEKKNEKKNKEKKWKKWERQKVKKSGKRCPRMFEIYPKGRKGPKMFNMVLNGLHWSQMVLNGLKNSAYWRQRKHLSTITTVGWTKNNKKPNFFEKQTKISETQKCLEIC